MTVEIIPVRDIGEVTTGMDLGEVLINALRGSGLTLVDNDVVVITQKIVSKSQGRVVQVAEDDEESKRRIILGESTYILRQRRGLVIAQTRHGFVCANAGVDTSNVDPGKVTLLPIDADRCATSVMRTIRATLKVRVGVVVSDTFGRPWRAGQTNVAIGVAGISALADYRGATDTFGTLLKATAIAVADELASAAELVMGKVERIPVAVIRGYEFPASASKSGDKQGVKALIRPPAQDLFR